MSRRPRVAVVYPFFAHYRKGVCEQLARSSEFAFWFYGGTEDVFSKPGNKGAGIEVWKPSPIVDFHHTRCYRLPLGLHWQTKIVRLVLSRSVDAVVFLAMPNTLSVWVAALLCKILGVRSLFWTHGWKKPDRGLRRWVKHCYFRLCGGLLLYGHRAEEIGKAQGFSEDQLSVIYNSLDLDAQKSAMALAAAQPRKDVQQRLLGRSDCQVVIVSCRLAPNRKIDQVIKAIAKISNEDSPVALIVIGDGPTRRQLESLADELGVYAKFVGACYDEKLIAQYFYVSDITVFPTDIGLTAIHSLTYGVPVLTHDRIEDHCPEIEAIVPGRNGDLFKRDDIDDMAATMRKWLCRDLPFPQRRCDSVIETWFNPRNQRQRIEEALQRMFSRGPRRRIRKKKLFAFRLSRRSKLYGVLRQLRAAHLRRRYGLTNVHPTFFPQTGSRISQDLTAGAYSFINDGCDIWPGVTLGKYVMIASRVSIVGLDHRFDQPAVPIIFSERPLEKKTVIEDDVWIGFGAVIMTGVRIGRGSVVAAHAVVTKDVGPYEIVGGVPAKAIGRRFDSDSDRREHDAMLAGPLVKPSFCDPPSVAWKSA